MAAHRRATASPSTTAHRLPTGKFTTTAYWFKYRLNLFSNFTYFLDDPVNGDQFEQADDRNVIGWTGSWTKRPSSSACRHATRSASSCGRTASTRSGCIRRANASGCRHTGRQRDRGQRRRLRAERHAVERLVPLDPRHPLRLVPLQRRFNRSRELGQRDVGHRVTEGFAGLRPVGQDRVLRQRGLRLPQQRRARRDHPRRSEDRRPGRPGHAAGAQQGRRARHAHRRDSERPVVARALVPEARQRAGVRRRCRHHRSGAAVQALRRRMEHALAAAAVDVRRPRPRLESRAFHRTARRRATTFPAHRHGGLGGGRRRSLRTVVGRLFLRYIGAYPLIEDNSVRSASSTVVDAQVGYEIAPKTKAAARHVQRVQRQDQRHHLLLRLAAARRAPEGVDDIHFHPGEKRSFRVTLSYTF